MVEGIRQEERNMTKKEKERRQELVKAILDHAKERGFSKDRYGNWKSANGTSRIKLKANNIRFEVKGMDRWIGVWSMPYKQLSSLMVNILCDRMAAYMDR